MNEKLLMCFQKVLFCRWRDRIFFCVIKVFFVWYSFFLWFQIWIVTDIEHFLLLCFFNKHWSYERSNPSKEVDKELLMNRTESFVTLRPFLLFIAPLFTKRQLFCSLNNFNCVFFMSFLRDRILRFIRTEVLWSFSSTRILTGNVFVGLLQTESTFSSYVFFQRFVFRETNLWKRTSLPLFCFCKICFFYSLSMNLY